MDRFIRNWLNKIVQLSDFEKNNFWAQKMKFTIWPNLTKWPFSQFSTFRGPCISNLRVWHITRLEMNNLIIRNRQISIYYHTSSFIHLFRIKWLFHYTPIFINYTAIIILFRVYTSKSKVTIYYHWFIHTPQQNWSYLERF